MVILGAEPILSFSHNDITVAHHERKTAEWEDPELTSACGHTKAATTCRATPSEDYLKPDRADLPQLKT